MRKTPIIIGTLLIAVLLVLGACAPTQLQRDEHPSGSYEAIAMGGGVVSLQASREKIVITDNLYGRRTFTYWKSNSQSSPSLGVSFDVKDVVTGEVKSEYLKYNCEEDYILIRYPFIGVLTFWKK